MKITRIIGEVTIVFEGTIEEWRTYSGEVDVKPEWKPWMEDFLSCLEGPSYSFVFKATREGHDWWAANYNTPAGLARFEEMKLEYKAWKELNQ